MNATTTTSSPDDVDPCFYPPAPMLSTRFWLVSVFGSVVSLISIVENLFLFFLFSTRRRHRKENVYMMMLAFFDIFVSVAYVFLMSINTLADYIESPGLIQLWFAYVLPMITISHIAITSSSFLIVAASFERYCVTLNSRCLRFAQKHRKLIALSAVFLGVLSKGTMYVEFEVMEQPECIGTMAAKRLLFRPFVFDTPYHVVFRLWYRNFVTVFAPFFILSYLNLRIVKALSQQTNLTVCQIAGNAVLDYARRKANARAATRTLVMVACCYLLSNLINVMVTLLEHLYKKRLPDNYPRIYIVLIDLISLLTTLACMFRLPIYLACQPALRGEVLHVMRSVICREMVEKRPQETSVPKSRSFESDTSTTHMSRSCIEDRQEALQWCPQSRDQTRSATSPYETLL